MATRKREIDCLTEYFDKSDGLDTFLDYLFDEKIMKPTDIPVNVRHAEKIRIIHESLHKALDENKIILLDFHWQLLPIYQIKISIITHYGTKDFLYGY